VHIHTPRRETSSPDSDDFTMIGLVKEVFAQDEQIPIFPSFGIGFDPRQTGQSQLSTGKIREDILTDRNEK